MRKLSLTTAAFKSQYTQASQQSPRERQYQIRQFLQSLIRRLDRQVRPRLGQFRKELLVDRRVVQDVEQPRYERVCDGIAAGKHHHLGFVLHTLPCRRGRVGSADGGVEQPAVDDWVRGVLEQVRVRNESVDLLRQSLCLC